jgi:hypothetical protein
VSWDTPLASWSVDILPELGGKDGAMDRVVEFASESGNPFETVLIVDETLNGSKNMPYERWKKHNIDFVGVIAPGNADASLRSLLTKFQAVQNSKHQIWVPEQTCGFYDSLGGSGGLLIGMQEVVIGLAQAKLAK